MADLLAGGQVAPPSKPKLPFARSTAKRSSLAATSDAAHPKERRVKLKRGVRRAFIAFFVLLITVPTVYFLWKGPIASLLAPKSPFTAKQQEDMGIPLYYPTALPGSFKIERDSIAAAGTNALLYAISDDTGKRINITLQTIPARLDLSPLYAVLTDLREFDTDFGKVKTGVSENDIQITNIVTEKTWIIINSAKDTLSQAELTALINSFKSS